MGWGSESFWQLRASFARLLGSGFYEVIVDRPDQRLQPGPVSCDGFEDDSAAVPPDADFVAVEAELPGQADRLRSAGPEDFRGFHSASSIRRDELLKSGHVGTISETERKKIMTTISIPSMLVGKFDSPLFPGNILEKVGKFLGVPDRWDFALKTSSSANSATAILN
jgi:hypothetical protein